MGDLFVRQERPITDEEIAFCERSIPAAFADAASRYPEALALDGDERATYRELAVAADRVAQALNERLGPASEPVGLMFRGTRGLIESLLGVLAAGKIAMPLDLSAPQARVEACLSDSGARLLLGDVSPSPVGDVVSPDA